MNVEPSAMHRAALTLHAMADSDRAWVLESLTPEQQRALDPLLAELRELGIPQDPRLFDAAAACHGVPARAVAETDPLRDADVRSLARLLVAEPPGVALALMATQEEAWRDRLLKHLPPEQARELRAAGASCVAPAVRRATLAEVARRLASPQETAYAPARRWPNARRCLQWIWRRS